MLLRIVFIYFSLAALVASAAQQDKSGFKLVGEINTPFLLNFIFTSCPSACPTQSAELKRVQDLLSPADKAASKFISISIDPETDTPEKLAAFATSIKADTTHWRFVRPADLDELRSLTQSLSAKVDKSASNTIEHKMVVYLVDKTGRVVQEYAGTSLDEKRIAKELSTLIRLGLPK